MVACRQPKIVTAAPPPPLLDEEDDDIPEYAVGEVDEHGETMV